MSTLASPATSVNSQNSQTRRSFEDYSTGGRLFREHKPISACTNRTQRAGYRDAETGDQAVRLVSSMTNNGMSRSAAIETVVR